VTSARTLAVRHRTLLIPAVVILAAGIARGWRPGFRAVRVPPSLLVMSLGGLALAIGVLVILAVSVDQWIRSVRA